MPTYVTAKLCCDGCDEEAETERVLLRSNENPLYTLKMPEGWVAQDPYTHATYCPTCWTSIMEAVLDEPDR